MKEKEITFTDIDYTYPKKSSIVCNKEKLYKEKSPVRVKEYVLEDSLSYQEKINEVSNDFSILQRKKDNFLKEYYLLKIYSPIINTVEFNKEMNTNDNYIKKFRNDYSIVERYYKVFRELNEENDKGLTEVFDTINELYDFLEGLTSDLAVFRKKYYNEFKVTSYALVKDKDVNQLEDLYERVQLELNRFKSLEEAYDSIVYHSGTEIVDAVKEFLNLKRKVDVRIDYHYFIPADDIISFTFTEWVDLFTKFKYVINKMQDKIVYTEKFMTKYRDLETKYAIVSIYNQKFR